MIYDVECVFCNGMIDFIFSCECVECICFVVNIFEVGKMIFKRNGLLLYMVVEMIVLIYDGVVWLWFDVVIVIVRYLCLFWFLMRVFKLVLWFIRDWVYWCVVGN